MTSSEPCQYLPWDSAFFGRRIARVSKHRLSQQDMEDILIWCDRQDIKCLYLLADSNHLETIQLVEDNDFHLVDIRITLQHVLNRGEGQRAQEESGLVRKWYIEDIKTLQYIARNSITNSRFYNDPCFSNEDSARLYETWIKRSCDGLADMVFVAEINKRVVGFITCHLLTENSAGEIGLIGIEKQARGHGIGKALVYQALDWFTKQSVKTVNVVTQGSNIPAQRLYQRCGFLTDNVQIWYHKWFHNCVSKPKP